MLCDRIHGDDPSFRVGEDDGVGDGGEADAVALFGGARLLRTPFEFFGGFGVGASHPTEQRAHDEPDHEADGSGESRQEGVIVGGVGLGEGGEDRGQQEEGKDGNSDHETKNLGKVSDVHVRAGHRSVEDAASPPTDR